MGLAESSLHIIIIWSNTEKYYDRILKDIINDFELIKIFKIKWDKDKFPDNLSIFFSHSLKDITDIEAKDIISKKEKYYGNGVLFAIIFKDNKPYYQLRHTVSGYKNVNINVFDKKCAFRKMTGGSPIYCSDDSWETNKDLTVLLGLNSKDFMLQYDRGDSTIEEIHSNCLGVLGYDSIEQFFYVMNNTIEYCVLRNHECITNEYIEESHGDIDLLVNHKKYAIRVTNARPIFTQEYRVHHFIKIRNRDVSVVFRYVGDNYFDKLWEEDILKSRKLNENLLYIPDPENQYYSLLYQTYAQKPLVDDDYPTKLFHYANEIKLKYYSDVTNCIEQLYYYLEKHEYRFVVPNDKSVFFNHWNIRKYLVLNYLKIKTNIQNLKVVHDNYHSLSDYFYFKGEMNGSPVFIKYGGIGDSCRNEYEFTKRVCKTDNKHFLDPIQFVCEDDHNYIIYKWIDGMSIEKYVKNADDYLKYNVKKQLIEIYETLQKAQIIHRDIRPDNFVVVNNNIILLDFQFAIDNIHRKELSCLEAKKNNIILYNLGDVKHYRYSKYAWRDSYSIKKVMQSLNIDVEDLMLDDDRPFYLSYYLILRREIFYIKQYLRSII